MSGERLGEVAAREPRGAWVRIMHNVWCGLEAEKRPPSIAQ